MQKYTKRAEYKELLVFYAIIFLCNPHGGISRIEKIYSISGRQSLSNLAAFPYLFFPI